MEDESDPTSSSTGELTHSIPMLKLNEYQIQMNRILLAVIIGTAAGILRVEGILHGLVMFVLCNLVGSGILTAYIGPSHVTEYFPNGSRDIFLGQNFSGLMTYILVWTLVYDVVHIF